MSTTLLLALLGGLVAGILAGYYFFKALCLKNYSPISDITQLQQQLQLLQIELAGRITPHQLASDYVQRQWFATCQQDLEKLKLVLVQKREQVLHLATLAEQKVSKEDVAANFVPKDVNNVIRQSLQAAQIKLATNEQQFLETNNELVELRKENETLLERLTSAKKEMADWHAQATDQFKNLAHEILKERGKDMVETNRQSLDHLLSPLKNDIGVFKKSIEDTRKEDIQDLTSLKKEIESLRTLNMQLSDDAQKLAGALKSDVKVQGNWGEDRLKYILEAEGLQRYIDYDSQGAFADEQQEVLRKPDFIINLPDGKHIVVDSKVSLNAYVDYFNCTDEARRRDCLKQLVKNINDHIDGLSAKNYHTLTGLNAPDFVCLFMHFEPALSMALNECPDILQRALNKKIVLLTPTTLVATAKMIRLIWQKENRVKNVEEIFKQCGLLYDKFASFIDDFQKIGDSLQTAQTTYGQAMDRLKEGKKKGDTIIGRFETIKKLEARTTKSLPTPLVNGVELLEDTQP